MINWIAIKNDYINGGGSYRKLAEKYGVSFSAFKRRAQAENWQALRREQLSIIEAETAGKSVERTADILAEFCTRAARIRLKLLTMGEEWLNVHGTITDTEDFRRMVRSFAEMGVFNDNVLTGDDSEDDDPLTRSLKEEAEKLNNIYYIEIG